MKSFIVLFICLVLSSTAFPKQKKIYWTDKNVPVLVFIGEPSSLDLQMIRLTSYEKQEIKLFHKKSGPGIYAFYLKGFAYKDDFGNKQTINQDGYFLIKKRYIRASKYKLKTSMKTKTKGKL